MLVVAALVLAFAAPVQAAKYYKWTDEKGVVHYTEKPGPGPSTEVSVRSSPAPATDAEAEAEAAAAAAGDPAEVDRITQLRRQQCERSRTNVALLEGGGAVMNVKDQNAGPEQPMTDAERAERLEISRKFVERFCTE
jgi:hypothetical protein